MPHDYKAPRRSNDNIISKARLANGITQADLARIIGVDKRQVSAWERGKHAIPLYALQRIAAALELDIIKLMDEQPDRKKYSLLANVRREKGYTQSKLAKALGVSQGLISTFENGANKPTEEMLKRISEILGVPIEALQSP